MAYDLTKSDGSVFVNLAEGSKNNVDSSLTFVGRNAVDYGEIQNENFLHLLENFSNSTAPSSPMSGQLWYDSSLRSLKVYDASRWNQLPNIIYNTTASNQISGDLWFNTTSGQLFSKSGSAYILIGPNSSATTAVSLASNVSINGVQFTGTASITILADTTNSLSTGTYLTGSSFNGSASATWGVNTGVEGQATPSVVVARDAAGDIRYVTGYGVSTSARYADLAEKYLADQEYEIGTVMVVGGDQEVTASKWGDTAIGVVSGQPGVKMNCDLEGGTYVALKGRVPVKVTGAVKKGQRLIAANDGKATAAVYHSTEVFAIALESSDGTKDTVEAVIL